jgi:hypothetical protein
MLQASFQFTVTEIVVECESDPEVAVTVTVELTGAGVDDPPPQPLSNPNPATLTVRSNKNWKRRRFFHPTQKSAIASAVSGGIGLDVRWRLAVVAEVVTVTVVEAVPGGVTLGGEKLHEAPAGRPDAQLNVTAEANPPCGDTEMVAVPLPPAVTAIDPEDEAMEKSGGRLMVYSALATALLRAPLASATACKVSVDATVIAPLYKVELVVGAEPFVV